MDIHHRESTKNCRDKYSVWPVTAFDEHRTAVESPEAEMLPFPNRWCSAEDSDKPVDGDWELLDKSPACALKTFVLLQVPPLFFLLPGPSLPLCWCW